jgi:hypothetical protein
MTRTTQSMLAAALFALAASGAALAKDVKLTLSGANEVPPVQTQASGEGTISVADDGTVTGTITTKGLQPTAAHIHVGAAGKNGPVAVPFTQEGNNFKAPPGAKLNADQIKAFQAGELYFNVHTAANPGGEIRGQLK